MLNRLTGALGIVDELIGFANKPEEISTDTNGKDVLGVRK